MTGTLQEHWESVYGNKAPTDVSWYRQHLELSLQLIERLCPDRAASILDVGAGASTLVDDLLVRGYSQISVLDISRSALAIAQQRLGEASQQVQWLVGDVCELPLAPAQYRLWHDRAVFHFLTQGDRRAAYVAQAAGAIQPGGHLIVSTFGPEGPQRCSGLDTQRYDAPELAGLFAPHFDLVGNQIDWHTTPAGTRQQFLTCVLQRL